VSHQRERHQEGHRDADRQADPVSDPSARLDPASFDEHARASAPAAQPPVFTTTPPAPPPTLEQQTQSRLAHWIIFGTMGLYLLALVGVLAHWIDLATYKEICQTFAAPLTLAAAVAAFLFNAKGRSKP